MRKGIYLICQECSKEYYRMKSWSKNSKYCSRKCFNKSRKGSNNPVHRIKNREIVNKKISEGLRKSTKWKLTKKGLESLRNSRIGKIASEKTKQKCRINALNTLEKLRKNNKISNIERMVEKLLITNKINFFSQQRILNITKADFYLPEKNIAIYCDGDYWHNLPDYIERDKRINKKLLENNYKVLRFWETDIKNNIKSCIEDIKEVIKCQN
jgi:very-short-patch-repair endonuclease